MKALWVKMEDKFNALPKVLRLIMIIFLIFLLLAFAYRIIISPIQNKINSYEANKVGILSSNLQLKSQIKKADDEAKQNKANNNTANINQLNKQLKQVEDQLNQYTQDYTPAGEIFEKLRGVLEQAKGLELVAIDHHAPEQITVGENNNDLQFWRHSITLVFKGGFYHTLEYLKLITNLKMYIVIESLQYTVEKYPDAQIELVVSTITERKNGN